MKIKEQDLFLPLKKYFNDKGYKVYGEVPYSYNSATDIIAVSDNEHIGIEMKVCFNGDVVHQAYQQTYWKTRVDKMYVAIGVKNPRDKKRIGVCEFHGIGILTVVNGEVREILAPKKLERTESRKDFTGWKESEVAGLKNNGTSSARDVLMRIKLFVKENPECNWRDIYENVQNHYASKESLVQSMGKFQNFYLPEFKRNL